MSDETVKISAFGHHVRDIVVTTRKKYRSGRRDTAVKVYTIAQESRYLLVHNVPDIKEDVKHELTKLCEQFGKIESLKLADYPVCEQFTKVYVVKYSVFGNAIAAKKRMDDYNFMGSVLHVCYAPELETIEDTRHKLNERNRYVAHKLGLIRSDNTDRNNTEHFDETEAQANVSNSDKSSGDATNVYNKLNDRIENKEFRDKIMSETQTDNGIKRTICEVDSYTDNRINVKTKVYRVSTSSTPKICWRK